MLELEYSSERAQLLNSKDSLVHAFACSLEYSSLSTLAGQSYHICGKLEKAFKASPSSQHQHCTDEAQRAETVLSAVSCIYIYRNKLVGMNW